LGSKAIQGVNAWNVWGDENRTFVPDVNDADLSRPRHHSLVVQSLGDRNCDMVSTHLARDESNLTTTVAFDPSASVIAITALPFDLRRAARFAEENVVEVLSARPHDRYRAPRRF
jgi:hypothetical protein